MHPLLVGGADVKIKSQKELQNGNLQVVVEVKPSEALMAVERNSHYKLGYPTETIQTACELLQASQVVWCSVSQQWIDI